ncbi:MAG: hypothetical protein JO370_13055 [Paucibacter sp.]|nr:hypothetical protein [Roseateles sp.]
MTLLGASPTAWAQAGPGGPATIPEINGAVALALLGFLGVVFVKWQRNRARADLFALLLICLAMFVRSLAAVAEPWVTADWVAWLDWLAQSALCATLLLTFVLALRSIGQRHRAIEGAALVLLLSTCLLGLPSRGEPEQSLRILQAFNTLFAVVSLFIVGREALRDDRNELWLVALTLALILVAGRRGLGAPASWVTQPHPEFLPLGVAAGVSVFLYALRQRQRRASALIAARADELKACLADQARRLETERVAARAHDCEQILLGERQRLMQDMHDGLGSALLSAMVAVEQGSMGQYEIVELLRECVDDLRLVIDSLEPVGHDLTALLATMRYRLGKRLHASGLQLAWTVHEMPPLEWLAPPDALQVLRLLQEAFNNVLKHAAATRVHLVARQIGPWVEIRINDDGDGFDPAEARPGRGLRSQRRRAEALRGHLRLESSPGQGTSFVLRLPVVREPRPAP